MRLSCNRSPIHRGTYIHRLQLHSNTFLPEFLVKYLICWLIHRGIIFYIIQQLPFTYYSFDYVAYTLVQYNFATELFDSVIFEFQLITYPG